MIIFQVEACLFKVHKYFLVRESKVFETLFQLPPGDDTAEGQDDHRPVYLPEVTVREFESLMHFLYYGMFDNCGVTLPQWIDILRVSKLFVCDNLVDRAIKEIHQHRPRIDPVEKIVLAVRHNIADWLAPSYAAICQRAQPLNSEEGHKLRLETTVLLARAREAVRQDHVSRTESRQAQGAGGRGGGRTGTSRTTTSSALPEPEPEPRPSSASSWQGWEGWTVPDSEDPFDPQRVAEIVDEVFKALDEERAT
ncbi:uncharacterized protein B0H18DRAFT_872039 [Fomitopsis serialis]|uniref:uncharacterized protein n=1 Tax=Fomitopsis serialis TaxID=139415 RepID=UPI0020072369|nr:uncharacterized protein B0H18DRAFT_872039 [Neoantrodia serialis]KAH9931576.1 hypothetical protein B0H18DRAFT_872039 [Neoantrodia serialis]